jgi:diacylglycerol kinase (ATP)
MTTIERVRTPPAADEETTPHTSTIAVVANSSKTLGGGLSELRRVLAREGVPDPIWHEVAKSRDAPERVREALEAGAELVFVWGGDGMVQRCVGALANTCSRRTSTSRPTSNEPSRSGSTVRGRGSTSAA